MNRLSALAILLTAASPPAQTRPDVTDFPALGQDFNRKIAPLLERHCLECHDTDTKKGELDLERFVDLAAVRKDPKTWQRVIEQLQNGEMPPKKKNRKQPAPAERAALIAWIRRYLDAEARASAGDPGAVVLRRLSNSEYTYSVRDLTGIASLDPVREFPVDSAAGEGFTNAGGAHVMSPALLEKYLAAGKQIAAHAVLLPNGFRFAESTSRADQASEILRTLRAFYLEATGGRGIDFSYRSPVRVARPEGEGEGRVNLQPYFAALLTHREALLADPGTAHTIAGNVGLNAKYFGALAAMLVARRSTGSFLLDDIRQKWRAARPEDAAALAAEVRSWQDRLWRFNKVGHLGLIRPWQEPVSPVATRRDVRLAITRATNSVFLSARRVATLGTSDQSSGTGAATVQWQRPRIERPGRPPILLRDLERGLTAFREIRGSALGATSKYLAAAAEIRQQRQRADLEAIAAKHQLEPALLRAWASYLGLDHGGRVAVGQYLSAQVRRVGGHEFVKGWKLDGVADYFLVSNASDRDVKIPGDMSAHKITVHPRPERWIAAGWMSPFDGRVTLRPSVRDAHSNCGNGVSWSFELRRGSATRILQSGNVDLGKAAKIEPMLRFEIRRGDLLSIVIGARDRSHVCDLTEIDLVVREVGNKNREWSLAADCAGDIHAGNPHPDRLGNRGVWHFYGGRNGRRTPEPGVPSGSRLERWSMAKDAAQAHRLADQIQEFLTKPLPADTAEPDANLHRQLTALHGPLFSHLDFADLIARGKEVSPTSFDADGNLTAKTPATLELEVPGSMFVGSKFVVRGVVHESSEANAVAQMTVGTSKPAAIGSLRAGEPLVVRSDAARAGLERSFAEFRNIFPAALCYARVVPADEVVTLLLYHREDDHLVRLMLDDAAKARLDHLWQELTFVSQEPARLVTVYEQLWQFATQDADPTKFEPMEGSIRERAAAFQKARVAARPTHVDALIALAPTVYRRPLAESESQNLRRLYGRLRSEALSHEAAFRLTLASLFAAPAFLYKAEKPAPGSKQAQVTGWELATRLAYFLTSSAPDAALRKAAATGTLTDTKTLVAQTRRLLADDRVRRLAIEFACQWLHIRDFDQLDAKNERLYPEFSVLRTSMYEESIRFFTDVFQNDRSVLSLLDSDHTFVDARLARFYDLPAPRDGWHRVDQTKKAGRGGILGLATTLAKQSGASRTSAILRGNWVSETLLGEKLPKPPKDVPQLPDRVPRGLSERQLIEQHTSHAACAKCHVRIDPYGFALEGFDAIGRRRAGADTKAKLPDGKQIEGLDGLRAYLLAERRGTFVRHFCKKLLGYALGRAVQLSDAPLLDEIMQRLRDHDYRVGVAVEAIVVSPQFRDVRGANRR